MLKQALNVTKRVLNFLNFYFTKELADDINDIEANHKVHRNVFRLSITLPAIIIGGIFFSYVPSGLQSYLKMIAASILGNYGNILGSSVKIGISTWLIGSISLVVTKWINQIYYRIKYHSTNSSHHLTPSELQNLILKYKEYLSSQLLLENFHPEKTEHTPLMLPLNADLDDESLSLRIKENFSFIISELKNCSTRIDKFNNTETSKATLKSLLYTFRQGNVLAFVEYTDKIHNAKTDLQELKELITDLKAKRQEPHEESKSDLSISHERLKVLHRPSLYNIKMPDFRRRSLEPVNLTEYDSKVENYTFNAEEMNAALKHAEIQFDNLNKKFKFNQ